MTAKFQLLLKKRGAFRRLAAERNPLSGMDPWQTALNIRCGVRYLRPSGSEKATMLLPEGAPFLPPPQTIATYSRPSSS